MSGNASQTSGKGTGRSAADAIVTLFLMLGGGALLAVAAVGIKLNGFMVDESVPAAEALYLAVSAGAYVVFLASSAWATMRVIRGRRAWWVPLLGWAGLVSLYAISLFF
ncbi:hypothetical protein [Clavibacter tessellarius]|uniref:hypothetical protein n=1 Tax=Clavibacter tessellarius TaxID=31965 RepID=UPI0039E7703A